MIPQRLKKLFHRYKKKNKLVVYNYTSNFQQYPNQPEPPSPKSPAPANLPSTTVIQLSKKKSSSIDTSAIAASDIATPPSYSEQLIAPNDPILSTRLPSHLATEEVKQHQEQATFIINETMRRKSTLPTFDTLQFRYEVLQKLGDGAFSNVYRGADRKSGHVVAIKVAHKHTEEDASGDHLHPSMKKKPRVTERANILKEVKIMQNIDHPNIIRLNDFMESQENYFLVMELCNGGELFHRIVDLTYFSEDLSRHIVGQLAQAVYHLHEECGVVHRDIKPENILFNAVPWIPSEYPKRYPFDDVTKKDEGKFTPGIGGGGVGRIKLADFGLSKIVWDAKTATPCGTMGYAAPEIVTDQTYSKGVDMWAMGCVLYTMLCGFPPFYDESISALTKKVARGDYSFLSPWWDPISVEAKDLIQGLLCVDPRKRYTIRQVLQHPWLTGSTMNKSGFVNLSPGPYFGTHHYNSEGGSLRIQALLNSSLSPKSMLDTPPPSHPPTNGVSPASASTTSSSSTGRRDIFSQDGMATLKEIFDITTAVQRMAEENSNTHQSHDNAPPIANEGLGQAKPSTDNPSPPPEDHRPPRTLALNLDNATLLKNRKRS
ncbi:Pkinase-domain-containing protein [Hesseltinella vesiculosa]|uniref:Pkinase-domain-containing protein n=1 Tax=Hesseltinella vesiculosa TaxID=101127 RepID=A0A1X2GF16_9FUNG|nr:Pkinase-domain-containing protein [Hesseltinella vesiculosa]